MPEPYILVVEDDRLTAAALSTSLTEAGHSVTLAYTYADGHQAVALELPKLAIIDIGLPDHSGLDLMREAVELHFPFLVMTANDTLEVVTEAIDLGAVGYIVKPITPSQMLPIVHSALARAADLSAAQDENTKVLDAIENARVISTAVGLLMERHKISQQAAGATLRLMARSSRKKMGEVALTIVGAAETINVPNDILEKAGAR